MARDATVKDKRHRFCIPLFVANLTGLLLFHMVGVVYLGVVVRTLERRFGLNSSQTGLLFGCNDVVHTVIVLFIGYFGRWSHKPRIISVTIMFSGLSCLMMTLPHWIFDSEPNGSTNITDSDLMITSKKAPMFCSLSTFNTSENECESVEGVSDSTSVKNEDSTNHAVFYVFVVAQLVSGIGSSGLMTMGVTYIDENVHRSKSSIYIGIVSSMYAIGPVCSYTLAGIVLKLPENLLTPTSQKPQDPSFIGCWWLGYLICGTVIILMAIPMWFFPKHYKGSVSDIVCTEKSMTETREEKHLDTETEKRATDQFKEIPRTLRKMLRNKLFMINLLCNLCQAYIIMGVNANIVRYVEIHFLERAFVASIIAALVTFAGGVGTFMSGIIISRKRLSPREGVRIIIVAASIFSLGAFVIMCLSCPQISMAGTINPTHNTLNVLNNCNRHCGCQTDRKSYVPVCGSDNLTYFSACFAGCSGNIDGTNVGCACLTNSNEMPESSLPYDSSGTASPGLCVSKCNLLVPFSLVLSLMFLFGNMSIVPMTMVNLRVVDRDERSFALAFISFIANLLGYFPAPILYGGLIDSSCRMWQRFAAVPPVSSSSCGRHSLGGISGDAGSCLLYDTAKFRQRIYGTVLGFKGLELTLAVILYIFMRNKTFEAEPEDENGLKCGEIVDVKALINSENARESTC